MPERGRIDCERALTLDPKLERLGEIQPRLPNAADRRQLQYCLYVDKSKLEAFGLKMEDLAEALNREKIKIASTSDRGGIPFLVLAGMPDAESLMGIVLTTRSGQAVHLRHVAVLETVARSKSRILSGKQERPN